MIWGYCDAFSSFRFPLNDPERLQKWLKAIRRESWQPTKHSYLCSLHFTQDSYKSNPKHFLKDDAVPSIACFSTDHPKILRKRTIEDSLPVSKYFYYEISVMIYFKFVLVLMNISIAFGCWVISCQINIF